MCNTFLEFFGDYPLSKSTSGVPEGLGVKQKNRVDIASCWNISKYIFTLVIALPAIVSDVSPASIDLVINLIMTMNVEGF